MSQVLTSDEFEPRKNVDLYPEVAQRIKLPDNPPYLLYGLSTARSGTTVSLNFMTAAELYDKAGKRYTVRASYQHFKAGYRHAMHGWPNDKEGECWTFDIPDASDSPVFYTKDPLGPYTHTESVYNSLRLLNMIEYPKDRLHFIFFTRYPTEVLASWKRNYSQLCAPEILRTNLITAYQTQIALRKDIMEQGLTHSYYLYESLRDYSPETVVSGLFSNITRSMNRVNGMELRVGEHTVDNWDPSEKAKIWHPDEPALYNRPELARVHTDAQSTRCLRYKQYDAEKLAQLLSDEDIQVLRDSPVFEIYDIFRTAFNQQYNLHVSPFK